MPQPNAEILHYRIGTPECTGTYACRIRMLDHSDLYEDKFLTYFDGRWYYPFSDQYFRGPVDFWIGPLQRRMS